MNRKRVKHISLVAGLLAGAVADGCLRLTNGNDGNLLIHTFVFVMTAIVVTVRSYYITLCLRRDT